MIQNHKIKIKNKCMNLLKRNKNMKTEELLNICKRDLNVKSSITKKKVANILKGEPTLKCKDGVWSIKK